MKGYTTTVEFHQLRSTLGEYVLLSGIQRPGQAVFEIENDAHLDN